VSRRAPRYRIALAATVSPMLGGDIVVSRTCDISLHGMSLDTAVWFPLGTRLAISLVDPLSGSALELVGDVVREPTKKRWILGILLVQPPPEWAAVVIGCARVSGPVPQAPARRRRVLVVGDEQRQRGAMALYVTSGWDVLFASDVESVNEALANITLDAVIAELDADDPRVHDIMADAKRVQPRARRIVRGKGRISDDLVHRVVDRDAGLDPLLDAVSANFPRPNSEPSI
jgi:hypothetical protein